jgi:hypothetical protein
MHEKTLQPTESNVNEIENITEHGRRNNTQFPCARTEHHGITEHIKCVPHMLYLWDIAIRSINRSAEKISSNFPENKSSDCSGFHMHEKSLQPTESNVNEIENINAFDRYIVNYRE